MRTWTERSNEVAYLLNPAFCCAMLTSSVLDYTSIKSEGMDYPLVFMVLPIILHAPTRKALPPNISTTLADWIQKNNLVTTYFHNRVISMKPFTQEAILYGFAQDWLILGEKGKLKSEISKNKINSFFKDHKEVKECINKSRFLGRWFASTGPAQTVMAFWRIKP